MTYQRYPAVIYPFGDGPEIPTVVFIPARFLNADRSLTEEGRRALVAIQREAMPDIPKSVHWLRIDGIKQRPIPFRGLGGKPPPPANSSYDDYVHARAAARRR